MVGIKLIKHLVDFIFPEHCVVCEEPLASGDEYICPVCIQHLPFTELPFSQDNPVARRLRTFVPVHKATSLMFYHSEGSSGKIIQEIKYHGRPEIGKVLAHYLAPVLQTDPPDLIVPIPLHKKKMKIRGYNQLEIFGRELARLLGARYEGNLLIKTRHTTTQTHKSPAERWQNVKSTFRCNIREDLSGRHVLVIDDVLTTGATLSAALAVLFDQHPEARISAATMSFKKD